MFLRHDLVQTADDGTLGLILASAFLIYVPDLGIIVLLHSSQDAWTCRRKFMGVTDLSRDYPSSSVITEISK